MNGINSLSRVKEAMAQAIFTAVSKGNLQHADYVISRLRSIEGLTGSDRITERKMLALTNAMECTPAALDFLVAVSMSSDKNSARIVTHITGCREDIPLSSHVSPECISLKSEKTSVDDFAVYLNTDIDALTVDEWVELIGNVCYVQRVIRLQVSHRQEIDLLHKEEE